MGIRAGYPTIGRYLFIDGSYLRIEYEKCLTEYVGHVEPIDFEAVKNAFNARKVFYYDGVEERLDGEHQTVYDTRIGPHLELLSQIRSLPGFHVFEGSIRGKKGKRRQKKIDVQLTVDALTHAFRKNTDEVILIAGDLDFEPLVTALIQLGTFVTIAAVPESASTEFRFSGDHYRPLGVDTLLSFAGPKLAKAFKIPEEFGIAFHGVAPEGTDKEIAAGTQQGNRVFIYQDTSPERTVSYFRLLIVTPGNIQARVWEHSNGDFLKKYVSGKVPDIIWD